MLAVTNDTQHTNEIIILFQLRKHSSKNSMQDVTIVANLLKEQ